MAVQKQKQKTFSVSVRVNVEVGMDVEAATLEEALEKAKQLKLDDVITINGEHNDSNMWVNGVYLRNHWVDTGTPA